MAAFRQPKRCTLPCAQIPSLGIVRFSWHENLLCQVEFLSRAARGGGTTATPPVSVGWFPAGEGVDFGGLGAGSLAQRQALGAFSLLFPRSWVMECIGAQHVLLCMLMVLPDQGGSLQGSPGVSQDILAVDDPGTGSGWQQSKQNWALPSVVGILGQNAMQ